MKSFLSFILLVAVGFGLNAQVHCAYDLAMQKREADHPGYRTVQNEWFRNAKSLIEQHRTDEVLQVPVVFHVVWNTDAQNIADSVIQSQIDVLNEDYRRLNANAIDTREIFLDRAGDANIEFYLATEDPDGNPTDGIIRVNTDRENFELDFFSQENTLDEVKFAETGGSDAWDTERYLNVWVCNMFSPFGQVFGIAYPPEGLENWPDGAAEPSPMVSGVIVHYTTVGRNNPVANDDGQEINNEGRTLVHEIGHYLGLRHIWGDGFFNGCDVDDGIDDTPNANAAGNYTCNYELNSCDEGEDDLPDNVENYMDYNQDYCMNMFTQGQIDFMRTVLQEYRPGLLWESVSTGDLTALESSVYPNPAEDVLRIEVPNVSSFNWELINVTGKLLRSELVAGNRGQTDLSDLAPGVYLLRLKSADSSLSSVKKIILK